LLVAAAAIIGSIATWVAGRMLTTPAVPLRCEISAPDVRAMAAGIHAGGTRQAEAGHDAPQPPTATGRPPVQRAGDSDSLHAAARREARSIQQQKEFGELFSGLVDGDADSVNTKMENRFYAEDWNQAWAGSREQSIRALFETNTALDGMAPLQVTCRSKNCQVVLAATDPQQVRELARKFMQAATRGDVGMRDQVVSFFPDVAAGRLVFYLSENGNTDLFR
jgi:hypothetical protein